jgi:hypothetical protein
MGLLRDIYKKKHKVPFWKQVAFKKWAAIDWSLGSFELEFNSDSHQMEVSNHTKFIAIKGTSQCKIKRQLNCNTQQLFSLHKDSIIDKIASLKNNAKQNKIYWKLLNKI